MTRHGSAFWHTGAVLFLIGALHALGVVLPAVAAVAPRANVTLNRADATLVQTSDTQWTLTKSGSTGGATVTWAVQATAGTTTSGILIYNGIFKVDNKGNAGATIGNIVVNLQTKTGNKWVTQSSVVADATQDDAATHANVAPAGNSEGRSSFDENSASGKLLFTDAATNSTFALVPEVTIPPGSTVKLLFSASFDNNVLNLAVGTQTRAEIIVSFGNARQATVKSAANVDINGNGIIDADEVWVQSVDAHPTTSVPAQTPSNVTVTLSDSPSDITTTGTVMFSNPNITLNQTTHSGTVVVDYNGGTNGGTITNCAHLTGSGQTQVVINTAGDTATFPNIISVDLTTCDTQVIGPHTCIPGTVGCGWKDGDVITYTQADWGDGATAAGVLLNNFFTALYGALGYVEVGVPGGGGFSMVFTSVGAVFNYQPASGPPAALNSDLLDPTSTASGVYGGEVLGLRFNIDFSNAGYLLGTSGIRLADLTLCNLTISGLNGSSVQAFSDVANMALGGGATPYAITDLNQLAASVNAAFDGGVVNVFAQDHLFNGACP